MKNFIISIFLITLFYSSICLIIYFYQKKLIFFPSKQIQEKINNEKVNQFYIKSIDWNNIHTLFLNNNSKKIVLFIHWNAWNVYFNLERLKLIDSLGLSAIFFDYRWYWKSNWEIKNEQDLYNDAKSIYNFLLENNYKSQDIILWWQSLGGAIVIDLAQNKNLSLTIIESTFYTMNEIAKERYWFLPVDFLLKFHFKNNEKIKNISSKILIIHSKDDEMINISHWKKLFDMVKNNSIFLEIKWSHNWWFYESYNIYYEKLKEIIE